MSAEQTNPGAEANLDYNVVDRRIVAALIDVALMVPTAPTGSGIDD